MRGQPSSSPSSEQRPCGSLPTRLSRPAGSSLLGSGPSSPDHTLDICWPSGWTERPHTTLLASTCAHPTSPALRGCVSVPLCMSPSRTSAGTTLVSHPLPTHFTLPSNPNCPQAKFPNPYWDPVIQPSLTPTWVLTTPHPISPYCWTSPSALVRYQPPHKGTEGDSPLCPDPSHKLDSK